jgi:hypothetical protein
MDGTKRRICGSSSVVPQSYELCLAVAFVERSEASGCCDHDDVASKSLVLRTCRLPERFHLRLVAAHDDTRLPDDRTGINEETSYRDDDDERRLENWSPFCLLLVSAIVMVMKSLCTLLTVLLAFLCHY